MKTPTQGTKSVLFGTKVPSRLILFPFRPFGKICAGSKGERRIGMSWWIKTFNSGRNLQILRNLIHGPKENEFSNEFSSTTANSSIKSLLTEVKPVVTGEHGFEYRYKSIKKQLVQSEFWCRKINWKKNYQHHILLLLSVRLRLCWRKSSL